MTDTSGIDPNVKIPAAVLAAAARSGAIHQAAYATEDTSAGNEGGQQEQTPADQQDPGFTAQQPAQEQPAPHGEESWEHKYKSVHGRYMRSQEQLRDMGAQLQDAMARIAQLEAAPRPQTQQPSVESLLTPEEVSEYGEEFLAVVAKKAREAMAPERAAYEAEIAQLRSRLDGVAGHVVQNSQQKMLQDLGEAVPNWRELNNDPNFLDWLKLPDPYSGAIRHDMLKAAYAQSNASRVAAFFSGFLSEEAAMAPADGGPAPVPSSSGKIPLASLAAPGRAKTAASANVPAEKPIFTRANIANFYAEVARGDYKGRDALRIEHEAAIFEAQREGRVRP